MSTVQTVYPAPNVPTAYAFLSKPPPPRKLKAPAEPLPEVPSVPASRRRSFSTIIAWAASVQPGSPGSPGSPKSPLNWMSWNLTKTEISPRRASIAVSPVKDIPFFLPFDSISPLQKELPRTPSAEDFPVNLTDLGYTSIFVDLPKTPTTPAATKAKVTKRPMASHPSTPSRSKSMRRLRSLSFLPSRARSGSTNALPALPISPGVVSPPITPESPKILSAALVKLRKASYTHVKGSKSMVAPPPPSLSRDIAIMQFMDGGKTEDNVKKVLKSQAKAAGNKEVVGDVFRDGKGGIWADRDEEMEYVSLLGNKTDKKDAKWISFGGDVKDGQDGDDEHLALDSLPSDRRGSAVSQDSELDPSNVVKLADDDVMVSLPVPSNIAAGSAPTGPVDAPKRAGLPLLIVPSRPNSCIDHLKNSPTLLHIDLQTFQVPATPGLKAPLSPGHRATLAAAKLEAPSSSPKSVASQGRRSIKPAPLALENVNKGDRRLPEIELEMEPVSGGVLYFEMVKHEFLADSFVPEVKAAASSGPSAPLNPSLVEEVIKKEQPVQPLRIIRKSMSMKFSGLLGRK